MVDHLVFGIELITIISLLVFGLGYSFGNLFNIQSKKFKNEIKYLEGKYHRIRQEKKEEEIENPRGFDLNALLSNPDIANIAKTVIDNNPDLVKNIVNALTGGNKSNTNGFDLDKLR